MFGAYIQFQALCVEKGHLLVAVLKLSPNNSFKNGSHDFHGIFKDYLPLDFKWPRNMDKDPNLSVFSWTYSTLLLKIPNFLNNIFK